MMSKSRKFEGKGHGSCRVARVRDRSSWRVRARSKALKIARMAHLALAVCIAPLAFACGAAPDESNGSSDQGLTRGPIQSPPHPVATVEPEPLPPPTTHSDPSTRESTQKCAGVNPSCTLGAVKWTPMNISLQAAGFDCTASQEYAQNDWAWLPTPGGLHSPSPGTYSWQQTGTKLLITICRESPALDAAISDGSLPSSSASQFSEATREPNACDACLPVADANDVYVIYADAFGKFVNIVVGADISKSPLL